MTDDAIRKAILARRARFIAAAMAGAGLSLSACRDGSPQVCLSAVPVDEKTNGIDAGQGTTVTEDASSEDAPPMPCLSVSPAACLKIAAPPSAIPVACLSVSKPHDAGPPGKP